MPYGPTVGDKICEQVASDVDGGTLNNESAADEQPQQQKHFREKLPKLEMLKMELKDTKQMVISTKFGWEKRVLQTELEHQKLLTEHNSLLVEMADLKKELQKTADQLAQKQSEQTELCAKWDDLEQKHSADSEKCSKAREEIVMKIDQLAQQLANFDLFKNAFPAKFTAMESFVGVLKDRFGNDLLKAVHPNIRPKIAEIFSNPSPNCWDVNACHSDLTIVDAQCLMVYKEKGNNWRSLFAKYSISHHACGIFYYELKILHIRGWVMLGFATKEMRLGRSVGSHSNSYAYSSVGWFCINGTEHKEKEKFARYDVVGCGVNLATGRLIFTKNGQPLDTSNLFVSSTDDSLFPCVSLGDSGDLVDANFGPNFKFNPSAV